MTAVEILSLPIRANPRIYQAEGTLDVYFIPPNKAGADAVIIPNNADSVEKEDLNAITRTTAEGAPSNLVEATAVLTLTVLPVDNQSVTIGDVTYFLVEAAPAAIREVQIGANVSDTLANLVTVINDGDGFGGPAHTEVTAASDATTLTATAIVAGTDGNAIDTATTVTGSFWDGVTLTGGIDSIVGEVIGQVCRVGDATPYTWHLWDGDAWLPITFGADQAALLSRLEIEAEFKVAYTSQYAEFTYDVDDQLTNVDIWDTSGKAAKLFSKVLTYTGTDLTSVAITDETSGLTLTKVITYLDGNIESVTKTTA